MFVKIHSLQKLKIRLYTKLVSKLIDVSLLLSSSFLVLSAKCTIFVVVVSYSIINLVDKLFSFEIKLI